MHHIEHLHHTADICIRIEGDQPADLFRGGVAAMAGIMEEGACSEPADLPVVFAICTVSIDRTALLVDFLSDVLALMQTEKAVFCRTEILRLSETEVEAEIHGYPATAFDEDIKAVTYHEAEVHQRPDEKWETLVIFDI